MSGGLRSGGSGREHEIARAQREVEGAVARVVRRKTELTDDQIERLADAIDQELVRREQKAARTAERRAAYEARQQT